MPKKCNRCKDGVVDTGNNELPCDCPKGASALFNIAGVEGHVSGAESRRHFFNSSPELLHESGEIKASSLPGRNKDARELKKIFKQFLGLLEKFEYPELFQFGEEEEMSQIKEFYMFTEKLHTLTAKMLGK